MQQFDYLPTDLQLEILNYIEIPKTNIQKVYETSRVRISSTPECKYIKIFKGYNRFKVRSWVLYCDKTNKPVYYYKSKVKVYSSKHPKYPKCLKVVSKLVYKLDNEDYNEY